MGTNWTDPECNAWLQQYGGGKSFEPIGNARIIAGVKLIGPGNSSAAARVTEKLFEEHKVPYNISRTTIDRIVNNPDGPFNTKTLITFFIMSGNETNFAKCVEPIENVGPTIELPKEANVVGQEDLDNGVELEEKDTIKTDNESSQNASTAHPDTKTPDEAKGIWQNTIKYLTRLHKDPFLYGIVVGLSLGFVIGMIVAAKIFTIH